MKAELIGHVNDSTGRWCVYRMPGKPGDLHEWYYGIELEGREPPYCTHNSMRSVLYQFNRPRFVPLPQNDGEDPEVHTFEFRIERPLSVEDI